jgi:hypothetical protein
VRPRACGWGCRRQALADGARALHGTTSCATRDLETDLPVRRAGVLRSWRRAGRPLALERSHAADDAQSWRAGTLSYPTLVLPAPVLGLFHKGPEVRQAAATQARGNAFGTRGYYVARRTDPESSAAPRKHSAATHPALPVKYAPPSSPSTTSGSRSPARLRPFPLARPPRNHPGLSHPRVPAAARAGTAAAADALQHPQSHSPLVGYPRSRAVTGAARQPLIQYAMDCT